MSDYVRNKFEWTHRRQAMRDRIERRGETPDGTVHMIRDERGRLLFSLSDMEDTETVRIVRVRLEMDFLPRPAPTSSSPNGLFQILDSHEEINMAVECHEEHTLFHILYCVIQVNHTPIRILDLLEGKVDFYLRRRSRLAHLVDIYFSRFAHWIDLW